MDETKGACEHVSDHSYSAISKLTQIFNGFWPFSKPKIVKKNLNIYAKAFDETTRFLFLLVFFESKILKKFFANFLTRCSHV